MGTNEKSNKNLIPFFCNTTFITNKIRKKIKLNDTVKDRTRNNEDALTENKIGHKMDGRMFSLKTKYVVFPHVERNQLSESQSDDSKYIKL